MQADAVIMEAGLAKEEKLDQLLSILGKAIIAFSGGVDSSYLLQRAVAVMGEENVVAITVVTALESHVAEPAASLAELLRVEHLIVSFDIFNEPRFVTNPPDRCYHCKKNIYTELAENARTTGLTGTILDGSNADDAADYRPGMRALEELSIRSPLLEVGLRKIEIRALAREAGLAVWDRPAGSCLATRFPYGEEITEVKLARVAAAEKFLGRMVPGIALRVRSHGNLARIEVEQKGQEKLWQNRDIVCDTLREIGYAYVTIDMGGYMTGSMNREL